LLGTGARQSRLHMTFDSYVAVQPLGGMENMESTMPGLRRVERQNEERPVIERASPADLAFLAMDTGTVPQQFAVILILERYGDFGLHELRQLIGDRIPALPGLRN
jgi:hypothetical protein